MKNETIDLAFTYAENLLTVNPKAEAGVPVDAIGVACDRAQAVLFLLTAQFMHPSNSDARLSDSIIYNALTDVQGTLEIIRTLVDHAHQSTSTWQPKPSRPTPQRSHAGGAHA